MLSCYYRVEHRKPTKARTTSPETQSEPTEPVQSGETDFAGALRKAASLEALLRGLSRELEESQSQEQKRQIERQIADVKGKTLEAGKAIVAEFRKYLPSEDQEFGLLRWELEYDRGAINLWASDADGRSALIGSAIYFAEVTEVHKSIYNETCAELPASRGKDSWCKVLVGRMQLNLTATGADFKSDERLEELIKSFDLEEMSRL